MLSKVKLHEVKKLEFQEESTSISKVTSYYEVCVCVYFYLYILPCLLRKIPKTGSTKEVTFIYLE